MTTPVTRFEAFTAEHLLLLAGFVGVCFLLAALGRSHRGTAREVRFRRAYALLIPCFTVPMQVLQLLPGDFDFAKSLPLQLCDFAWMAAVVALWTRHWAATALVYFWGLTLTIQGIITPSLTDLFPHPQYFMFWGMHFFTVWAAVYLTFGLGVRPGWRSFRFAVAATAVWAVAVMTFNALTGTNYGYLNRKPAVGTLLDLFGPWPGYVAVEIALVASVWALMTWPWTRAVRPERVRRVRRGMVVVMLLMVLFVGLQQFTLWSGAPSAAKDCAIHAVPYPGADAAAPALAVAPMFPAAMVRRGATVNDASCLNRTPVYGVVDARDVADVREALAFAREHELTVSVAGTRHAMGGQAMRPGALLLDMRGMDSVRVDTARRTVTVGAGARWHDVLEAVHPLGLSVATMPSIDVLSVGGTVSVNAHGLDFRQGSLSSSIRSLRIVTADGVVHTVGPDREPALFRAAVGGYGLLGVILDVELELVGSAVYRLRSRTLATADFPEFFSTRIAANDDVRMTYTHLSTSPGSLLREAIVYTYESVPDGEPVPDLATRDSDRLGRLVLNLARRGVAGQRLKWTLQRDLLPHLRTCHTARNRALRDAEACMVARNQAMFESLDLRRNRLPQYTDVLHEYFLPPDKLVPFLDDLGVELGRHQAVLLNASVRAVHREDIALDYAQGDRFSVVLYLSQRVSRAGNQDMADLTQRLVTRSLARGGTFYLPYQQHYTAQQVRQAYPGFDTFVHTKRRFDPDLRFRNSLWDRYAEPELINLR